MHQATAARSAFARFRADLRADLVSGFLVFLIALPLCLAISLASGCPATAGVLTAICGGLIAPWISNSALTIKGPAAGMIAIVLGCIVAFGGGADAAPEAQRQAYRLMLGVGVVAGGIQILCALLRSGFVSELFPTAAVHGLLASIGVIIMANQTHKMLGVTVPPNMVHGVPHPKEPLELLAEIPKSIWEANPEIALIGLSALGIMFAWPLIKWAPLRRLPAQMAVILVGIPLGYLFDLEHAHTYTFHGASYEISSKFLVAVPASLLTAVQTPDFSGVFTTAGATWIVMFVLIGSLESLLSAKAVDLLDPERRKTDFNRDLLAVGVGNAVAASLGGLPMISEIVRSKANIDNGARSRFANMFHGLFILLFVALLPWLIHRIPLAALAAMLVYTGFRLAHPREFLHMYRVGMEELVVFVGTMIGVLATDLLIGVFIGVALSIAAHIVHGVSPKALFRADLEADHPDEHTTRLRVHSSAVFSNWLGLRKRLLAVARDQTVILDLSRASLVDHTVMEKLHQLAEDFFHEGRHLLVIGLRGHQSLSAHPLAARKKQDAAAQDPVAVSAQRD